MFDDQGYINVISDLNKSIYGRVKAETVLGCKPNLYSEYYEPYLIYNCNYTKDERTYVQFGVTKVYPVESRGKITLDNDTLKEEYY